MTGLSVLHIDVSLDRVHVHAGQVLWRPEDVRDSMYIVINGRLRAINESEEGGVNIVAGYGQGGTVGGRCFSWTQVTEILDRPTEQHELEDGCYTSCEPACPCRHFRKKVARYFGSRRRIHFVSRSSIGIRQPR